MVKRERGIINISHFSPYRKDGAIHNLSFFQGISQNAMEIVGDFFEDYYRQMGHTYMKKVRYNLFLFILSTQYLYKYM